MASSCFFVLCGWSTLPSQVAVPDDLPLLSSYFLFHIAATWLYIAASTHKTLWNHPQVMLTHHQYTEQTVASGCAGKVCLLWRRIPNIQNWRCLQHVKTLPHLKYLTNLWKSWVFTIFFFFLCCQPQQLSVVLPYTHCAKATSSVNLHV